MTFPTPDDIYQVHVSLMGIEPPIWRRLLLRQDMLLPRVHDVLQLAMGWTDSHLHQFKVNEVRFGEPDIEFEPGPIDYRQISLNQIAPGRGTTCTYEYDFGDSWKHLLVVEAELPVDSVEGHIPRCIEGSRACPPEDCGGTWGYADFLRAWREPAHPEHEANRQWSGHAFDPEAFDLERVNRNLARRFPSGGSRTRRSAAPRGPQAR